VKQLSIFDVIEESKKQEGFKRCDMCKEFLDLSEFWNNKYKHDGLSSTCKSCVKSNSKRKKEHYDRLYSLQDGRCAICDAHRLELTKDFAVDHCHTTGQIRELLCNACNTGIGYFDDDVDKMRKAVKYIIKHNKAKGRH
jgi:hypothetical protein